MESKWFARAGVGVFVAIAITVTAIEMQAATEHGVASGRVAAVIARDPLQKELTRCQSIGEAGASDLSCLQAWKENRRRFLGLDARSSASEVAAGGRDATPTIGADISASGAPPVPVIARGR